MPTYGYAPTSNLRVQLNMLRTALAEPYDYAAEDTAAPVEGYFTTEELIDLLYRAEVRFAMDAPNDALSGLLTTQTRTTVSGTASYALPGTDQTLADEPPILRLASVEADLGWGRLYDAKLVPRGEFRRLTKSTLYRPTPGRPLASVESATSLIIAPTPGAEAGANKLLFRYARIPRRRFRHHHGRVDSSTTTTIVDAALLQATGFWTIDCQCTVRLLEGPNVGEERTVLSFDGGTDTLTMNFPFSTAPAAGVDYLLGEVSALNPEHTDAVIAYAAYLGLLKDRDEESAKHLATYRAALDGLKERYSSGSEMPSGVSP